MKIDIASVGGRLHYRGGVGDWENTDNVERKFERKKRRKQKDTSHGVGGFADLKLEVYKRVPIRV